MRKISGQITCESKKEIPNGAVATISVIDCGRMDAPSITLGKQEIKDPKSFPIQFEIEYDDSFLKAEGFHGRYTVQTRIETNGKLNFITDTSFSIVSDHATRKLADTIDFHVIVVN